MNEEDVDKPSLIATGGPLDGTVFVVSPAQRSFTLGSATTANARFELTNVDAEHARLSVGAHGLVLSDLGSQTGTYVNGEKIEAEHVLHDGDRICLGPPGSKGSAKLLVRLPAAWTPPDDEELVLVKPRVEMGLEPVPEKPAPLPAPLPPPPAPFAPPPPPPPPPESPGPMTVPPPPPPPPPAPDPAAAPRPAEARKKPEYTDEPPSILGSARVESPPAPRGEAPPRLEKAAPMKKAAPRRGRIRGPFPTMTLLVTLGVAGLGAGGYWAATNLFKKVPAITGVVPPKVEPGRSVTISGSGFASTPASNTVRIGDQVGVVTSATDAQLTVTVPTALGVEVSQVPVVVETAVGKSNAGSLIVFRPPQVNGIQPDVALPGESVVVTGGNLDGKPLTVTIGGMAAQVTEAEPGTLKVVVPDIPVIEGRTTPVHVQIGSESAKPAELLIGRLPMVLEVTPPQGAAGDRVVLKGRGFDPSPRGNVVLFGEEPALVLAASATELTVATPRAPLGETQTKVPLIVKAGGATSSGTKSFVVTRLSATTFVPHFFASAVPDDAEGALAFVATDLGPLLVLGGKGPAASVAERAVQTAAALNALMKRPDGPPAFELRTDPEAAVGVAGVPAPVLTVVPEDAEAYGRAWEGARAARRSASPRFLAQYWTALLQDYATLFVGRKRPIKVLELSPRGKVLADLYAEAARTAGADAGVPTSLVLPTSPSLAKGLREMALLLPAEGQARAGATIEGRWDGTMQEGGATRDIQVRFRYEGSRLGGSLTSRRGTLDMQTPLRDVALDKGTLRFAVDLSGAPLYFRGTVEGQAVSGTIGKSASEKSGPGSFALKFVE